MNNQTFEQEKQQMRHRMMLRDTAIHWAKQMGIPVVMQWPELRKLIKQYLRYYKQDVNAELAKAGMTNGNENNP